MTEIGLPNGRFDKALMACLRKSVSE